jgi:hypothetical protein
MADGQLMSQQPQAWHSFALLISAMVIFPE